MSPILEVLIGLVFIFSLLSILVTQVNAIVAQTLRLRSKYLFDTVKNIIHDKELTARFVTHPLIKMINFPDVEGMEKWDVILPSQQLTEEQAQQILDATLSGVDWVDSKTFSNVLLSMISVHEDRKLFAVLDDIATQMDNETARRDIRRKINSIVETGQGIDDLVASINALPASAHKKALVERLRDISTQIGDKGLKTDINVSLMAGVQYIKDQYLKNAIGTILATSKTLEEVETKLAKWFDDSSYKATELFKRDMKYYSYLIGLIVALVINVDTIYMSRQLWNDPILRSTLAETASTIDIATLEQANTDATEIINSDEATELSDYNASLAATLETVSLLQDTRIPLGWDFVDLSDVPDNDPRLDDSRYFWNLIPGNNPDGWLWMLGIKIVGIVATMFAIGQGAPFWFNILRQIR